MCNCMCEMKKEFANMIIEKCFASLCNQGIFLECGTLVLTFDSPDTPKNAELSVVFVGGADE